MEKQISFDFAQGRLSGLRARFGMTKRAVGLVRSRRREYLPLRKTYRLASSLTADWLFCRRQRDQRHSDNKQHSRSNQFSSRDHITHCLHRHKCSMG
jgi:hypothetical protein